MLEHCAAGWRQRVRIWRQVVKGPFGGVNGVVFSGDAGKTWRLEIIAHRMATAPTVCRTTSFVSYFAGIYALWCSRKPVEGGKWEEPQALTERFARAYGRYDVAGDGDTAHICWMDRRHDKWRFNPTGPRVENCDIYYRRRKDSDSAWGKEVW